MIRAMDILHTAEKIMDSGKNCDPTQDMFLVPGAFVTSDVGDSGDKIYQIISIEGNNLAKVKNIETKKIFLLPTEFLSTVLVNDPFDDDLMKTYKIDKEDDDDKDSSGEYKVNRIGVKKPDEPKDTPSQNGIYLLGGQPAYAKSRFDRKSQLARNPLYTQKMSDK